ncbi:MAG: hypothetical protein JWQ87_3907 [Candidatus Sulfotelmatobacter sp.]|nr:hypothetical protein [Candidatus Sulfotelmatobacter sp.]
MKHGKDVRDPSGHPRDPNAAKDVPALMFMMVEKSPGAFQLRFVSNDDLLHDLQSKEHFRPFWMTLISSMRSFASDSKVHQLPNVRIDEL